MLDSVQTDNSPRLTTLVSGIISDAQNLIRQEVALARREIRDEMAKAKSAAIALGVGVVILAVGGILLSAMLVQMLYWSTNFQLPLWACYGIVGGLMVVVGGLLLGTARNQANRIDLVPHQTVESMKENVQWIKNQTA